ncbi:MAG: exo-alpha-sialidase [Clostridia bacterium]|nr:exo-alpha-sialidase [Clostridia bacterium]
MNQYERELSLPKVGKEVLFLHTDENVSRVGEGAFLRLKSGAILYAYTEYCSDNYHDHGEANIAAIYSYDEGETWQDKHILIYKDADAANLMSVSFLRLSEEEILIFYLKKYKIGDRMMCVPQVRSSFDEGKTWGEARRCVAEDNYFILNNDRVLRLQNGRIIMALAYNGPDGVKGKHGEAVRYTVSDDNGKTWHDNGICHAMPFENLRGFEEPGMYQHEDGTIWSYYRTNVGCQFEAVSTDNGDSFSTPKPSVFFTGARSPMLVKKLWGTHTAAVWNPISLYTGRNLGKLRGRAPLMLAVSTSDGIGHGKEAFDKLFLIEDDFGNDYSYPAIIDGNGYFLVAYYHSNGREKPLNCLKITKIQKEEIAE